MSDQPKQIPVPAEGEMVLGGVSQPRMTSGDPLSRGNVDPSDVPRSIIEAHHQSDMVDLEIRQRQRVQRYQVQRWVNAMVMDIFHEIGRVVMELRRAKWNSSTDPKIDGITFRPFVLYSKKDLRHYLPNFEFEGIQFWWERGNQYPVQSNVNYADDGWIRWYNDCIAAVQNHEKAHRDDPLVCACKDNGCETGGWGCKGDCGCAACRESYADFMSSE